MALEKFTPLANVTEPSLDISSPVTPRFVGAPKLVLAVKVVPLMLTPVIVLLSILVKLIPSKLALLRFVLSKIVPVNVAPPKVALDKLAWAKRVLFNANSIIKNLTKVL